MAIPKLSLNSVLGLFKKGRERIVIVVLLLVGIYLGRLVYDMGRKTTGDTDTTIQEVLEEVGYGTTTTAQGGARNAAKANPKAIVANLLRVPGEEEIIRPIVKKLPFSPRENIENIRKKVRDLIVVAETQMASRNWGKAIEVWDEVQKLDPQS